MSEKCHRCDKIFSDLSALSEHLKSAHEMKKKFKCNFCGKQFLTYLYFNKHINSVHKNDKSMENGENFKCSQCDKSFKKNRILKHHFNRVHLVQKRDSRDKIFVKLWQSSYGVEERKMPKYSSEAFESQQKFKNPEINAKPGRELDYKLINYIIYNMKQHIDEKQVHLLCLGDNNLRNESDTLDEFFKKIDDLVTKFLVIKNCVLVLVSMLPSLPTDETSKDRFKKANLKFASLAKDHENISYLDLTKQYVKDGKIDESLYAKKYPTDVHLNDKGTKLYVKCIHQHLMWLKM